VSILNSEEKIFYRELVEVWLKVSKWRNGSPILDFPCDNSYATWGIEWQQEIK